MKSKRCIYEKDGQWYLKCADTQTACCCRDKAAAEQLLCLAESCYGKSVLFMRNKETCVGKVTNTGLLYEHGEDNSPTEVLFIRYEGGTYRKSRADCKILES